MPSTKWRPGAIRVQRNSGRCLWRHLGRIPGRDRNPRGKSPAPKNPGRNFAEKCPRFNPVRQARVRKKVRSDTAEFDHILFRILNPEISSDLERFQRGWERYGENYRWRIWHLIPSSSIFGPWTILNLGFSGKPGTFPLLLAMKSFPAKIQSSRTSGQFWKKK